VVNHGESIIDGSAAEVPKFSLTLDPDHRSGIIDLVRNEEGRQTGQIEERTVPNLSLSTSYVLAP
jgi:hypothetical protein